MIKNGWIRDVDGAWWRLDDVWTIFPTEDGVIASFYKTVEFYEDGICIYRPSESSINPYEECSHHLDEMMGME